MKKLSVLLCIYILITSHNLTLPQDSFQKFDISKLPYKKLIGNYSILKLSDLIPKVLKNEKVKLQNIKSPKNTIVYFTSPGITFSLYPEPDKFGYIDPSSWELILDFAPFSKEKKAYTVENRIYINQQFYGKYKITYNNKQKLQTIKIPIERIDTFLGEVSIEIKLYNSPKNFGVLYNASLIKKSI